MTAAVRHRASVLQYLFWTRVFPFRLGAQRDGSTKGRLSKYSVRAGLERGQLDEQHQTVRQREAASAALSLQVLKRQGFARSPACRLLGRTEPVSSLTEDATRFFSRSSHRNDTTVVKPAASSAFVNPGTRLPLIRYSSSFAGLPRIEPG